MNVYQNLSTCCIWNLYGWILRSKDEHVFCRSVCQFKKRSHIRMFVGRSVLGPVPWWMQTFRAAPSSKPLMMCHETISAWARFCVQPYGQGQNKSKFYPQMGRFGMVGRCYPQIPPKKPWKFSTVRPVVAELKRRGVEIQLRTTESVPLGGVKLGGFLGVTSDYPMFLSWLKIIR